jgi:hypothetical protein
MACLLVVLRQEGRPTPAVDQTIGAGIEELERIPRVPDPG